MTAEELNAKLHKTCPDGFFGETPPFPGFDEAWADAVAHEIASEEKAFNYDDRLYMRDQSRYHLLFVLSPRDTYAPIVEERAGPLDNDDLLPRQEWLGYLDSAKKEIEEQLALFTDLQEMIQEGIPPTSRIIKLGFKPLDNE